MRFQEQEKRKAVTFSYDDGVRQDRRLAEIFDKYGIKGTFNFNSDLLRCNYSKEDIHSCFLANGHEIAFGFYCVLYVVAIFVGV